jgi:hypothetical protein
MHLPCLRSDKLIDPLKSKIIMTAQIAESLRYRGKTNSLWVLPLESYLDRYNNREAFAKTHRHTACFRGYIGYWEIADNKLFLNRIETLDGEEYPLDSLFPRRQAPIFAEWFSGELRCPKGKMLKYVHSAFGSIYEHEDLIVIRNGEVESERTIISPLPPPIDPIEEFDVPEHLKD